MRYPCARCHCAVWPCAKTLSVVQPCKACPCSWCTSVSCHSAKYLCAAFVVAACWFLFSRCRSGAGPRRECNGRLDTHWEPAETGSPARGWHRQSIFNYNKGEEIKEKENPQRRPRRRNNSNPNATNQGHRLANRKEPAIDNRWEKATVALLAPKTTRSLESPIQNW